MLRILFRDARRTKRRMSVLNALWLVVIVALTGASPGTPPADWERLVTHADTIVVHKNRRVMELRNGDQIVRSYKVQLGKVPVGPKLVRGDGRTPEGEYTIAARKENSSYHRALKISYPNDSDWNRAQKIGLDPGDLIMIHGLPNGIPASRLARDWTNGCIAVSNSEIEEIWRLVDVGAKVVILP